MVASGSRSRLDSRGTTSDTLRCWSSISTDRTLMLARSFMLRKIQQNTPSIPELPGKMVCVTFNIRRFLCAA
jgi:hypothetical protein